MSLSVGDLRPGGEEPERQPFGFTKAEWKRQKGGRVGAVLVIFAVLWLLMRGCAHAQFGGHIVFDPTMYARQLRQLQQETAAVTNLAQQLRYMIKNTTGGGGGLWQSNQNLLANLGGIISEQQGLSYSAENLIQQFEQLYPGFQPPPGTPPASPQMSMDTALNTLNGTLQSVQMQANNFQAEQASLSNLEIKNNAAIGALQAVQTGNEVALAEAQQIQELRQLTMSAQNAQTVAAAAQVNAQVESVETAQAIIGAPYVPDATDIVTSTANLPGTN